MIKVFDEFIGAKLKRAYAIPDDTDGFVAVVLSFDNGRSLHMEAQVLGDQEVVPTIGIVKADWELINAERTRLISVDLVPKEECSKSGVTYEGTTIAPK